MASRTQHRSSAVAGTVAAVLAAGVLAGCGTESADPPQGTGPSQAADVDEMAGHDGRVCPKRLPQEEDRGFGAHEPASTAPTLPSPDSAWVCRYDLSDARPQPEGDGREGWVRAGRAQPVEPFLLPVLERHLRGLVPAEEQRACTADLGPRWLLVHSHRGDLTGVLVDDFGCDDVRLTDEPFVTVPGEAAQPGTVPGVLSGHPALLDLMKTAHRARR